MIPTQVPSNLDLEDATTEELSGRWAILVDLYSEFQGAAGAFFAIALLVFVGSIAAHEWEYISDATMIAGVIGSLCLFSISAYSYVWFRWVKRREGMVLSRLKESQDNGHDNSDSAR